MLWLQASFITNIYFITDKTKAGRDVSFNLVPLPHGTSLPSAKNRKLATVKALEVAHQEQGKVSNSTFLSKNMKKEAQRPKTHNEVANRNIAKREGADGSGVTSAKDATSTRTPSGEKFREPIPCRGRKELISLVHEALQGTNQKPVSVPVSKRKRIAAPPRQADCKFVYLTPMPLHSAGAAVAGAGLLKNKGNFSLYFLVCSFEIKDSQFSTRLNFVLLVPRGWKTKPRRSLCWHQGFSGSRGNWLQVYY